MSSILVNSPRVPAPKNKNVAFLQSVSQETLSQEIFIKKLIIRIIDVSIGGEIR